MPETSIKLPDGTEIHIKGSVEEVARITATVRGDAATSKPRSSKSTKEPKPKAGELNDHEDVVLQVVVAIKNADDSERFDGIRDSSNQVNRVLLPLFVANTEGIDGLTSGEIHRVLRQLGDRITLTNISTTLGAAARKHILSSKETKRGARGTKYQISRPGSKYLASIIENGV